MALLAGGFTLIKKLAAGCIARVIASESLPAAHDGIDIERIKFEPAALAADALRRDHRGAAAQKAIEYERTARGAVHHRVGDQRHRLHRWMERQQVAFFAATAEGIDSRIVPDVAAVAPELAELDVVAMRAGAALENQHQFVLTAI